MALLSLAHITKSFGSVPVVRGISFRVEKGEFVSLLGPSGCGKTTTLRMIAGFERPDAGRIHLAGEDVTGRPPYARSTGMVFQNYALFPHMTVAANVGFGLRMRRVPAPQRAARVREALDLVRLAGLEDRLPRELSGGQQQRVALARAIAIQPDLLLLDEPLSNLDARLREEMRLELKQIQRRTGITTLFVTHDQEEALTLSDRILLMEGGEIRDQGTPWEVYQRPATAFGARFIGHVNVLEGSVAETREGSVQVRTGEGLIFWAATDLRLAAGTPVMVALREERIRLAGEAMPAEPGVCAVPVQVEWTTFLGPAYHYLCRSVPAGVRLAVRRVSDGDAPPLAPGAAATAWWREADAVVIARAGGGPAGAASGQAGLP